MANTLSIGYMLQWTWHRSTPASSTTPSCSARPAASSTQAAAPPSRPAARAPSEGRHPARRGLHQAHCHRACRESAGGSCAASCACMAVSGRHLRQLCGLCWGGIYRRGCVRGMPMRPAPTPRRLHGRSVLHCASPLLQVGSKTGWQQNSKYQHTSASCIIYAEKQTILLTCSCVLTLAPSCMASNVCTSGESAVSRPNLMIWAVAKVSVTSRRQCNCHTAAYNAFAHDRSMF